MNTYCAFQEEDDMRTLIFGHRGAKAYYPQNTLLSFEKALEMGADGLELDVHYSKDGKLMVFHDFELDALTAKKGPVAAYTAAELMATEVRHEKYSGCCIPSLEQVLELIRDFGAENNKTLYLNVELKAGSGLYPGIEASVLELCSQYMPLDQVIFSSFDHFALKAIKAQHPTAMIGVLTMEAMVDPHLYLKHLEADFYHPNVMTLFPSILDQLREEGVAVNPYTVNDLSQAKDLLRLGLFGLITDVPDQLLALRKEVQHV